MLRAAWMLLILAPRVVADGGAILLRQESGPLAITAFASPSPLLAGPVDISVLVQDRESLSALLDADVTLHLSHGASEVTVKATRAQAQNKLLYAASVNLPDAGEWKYSITVQRGSAQTAVSGSAILLTAQAGLSSHWAAIAAAPACILLFALHQFLKARNTGRTAVLL